jgi:hypothetical protein
MEYPITSWIQLAMRAPSGDNSQPWDFSFYSGHFRISINQDRAKHFLDQNHSASWISMGCLCENLNLSAAQFGFSCQITIDSDSSVDVSYETIKPVKNNVVRDSILGRQTFRGALESVDLSLSEYHKKFSDVPGERSFEWKIVKSVSQDLLKEWSWLEALLWLKTPLMGDFTKWLRLKTKNFEDGVTLENLQIGFVDKISLFIFKKFPSLVRLIPFFVLNYQTKIRLNFLLENSSGLLVLSGPFKNFEDYFYAGREIQRMWLFMEENKIKAQPIAIQSLYLNFVKSISNQQTLNATQLDKIADIRQLTYKELQINQSLVYAFRFGSSNVELPKMPRRHLSDNHF